jgi:hypothetical protein
VDTYNYPAFRIRIPDWPDFDWVCGSGYRKAKVTKYKVISVYSGKLFMKLGHCSQGLKIEFTKKKQLGGSGY